MSLIRFELHLALKSDDTQKFKYIFDSWSNIIGLKEGGTYYVSPKKINFDVTQVYDNEADAYIGSESFNSHHDGKAFSELIDGTELSFEYGGICCFKWEKKYGFKDEWGGNASAPSITLRKGTTLTVDTSVGGDPDGSGPIVDGMKIKVAPIFTELRPQTKEDCSVELTTSVSDIKDSMSLPEPLPDSTDREISVIIGEEPSGAHPVLIREGERI